MKSLARPSFFRVFDVLLGLGNPGMKLSSWTHDGIAWERERHAFSGSKHGLTIEIFTLTRSGKRGWSVMIVKEFWWVGDAAKAVKSARWAKPIDGQRNDILNWFRGQEASLGRHHVIGNSELTRSTAEDESEIVDEIRD